MEDPSRLTPSHRHHLKLNLCGGYGSGQLDFPAKATYVKIENIWKVYWMRGNLKWTFYEPRPTVKNLQAFTKLVDEDKYYCFKG